MSLLFINGAHESFTPTQSGAFATIIWECCKVAAREGLRPHVLSIRCDAKPFDWPATTFIDYPWPPKNRLAGKLFSLQRRLTGWRHIRHAAYAARVADAIRSERLAGLPMVLFNDPELAVFLREKFPAARILHWFQNQHDCSERFRKRYVEAADVTLAVSGFTADWVASFYGINRDRIRVVYNATDAEQFFPAAEPPAGKPVINFVGRTHSNKGPDLLLKAAIRLARRSLEFEIQMIGSNFFETFVLDDYQLELRRLADELRGLGITVHAPGHIGREALPAELRNAHIHVVPARWDEPFGMTTLEGMATGLATVASRTGGTPEVVGDAALMFQKDSVAELGERLTQLIEDEELRKELAGRGRLRAMEFSWERAWESLKELAAGTLDGSLTSTAISVALN